VALVANNDSISTNNVRDVSVSNVPGVGKRDALTVVKNLPDGTTERSRYTNEYQWEQGELWQERMEKWLCIREAFVDETLLTFVVFRLWSATAAVTLVSLPAFGYVLTAGLGLSLLALVGVVCRGGWKVVEGSLLRVFTILVAVWG
jgi:hypothetical protein